MKQFKQAIIHVGTDKTGSSALQKAMGSMRANLLRRGLVAYLPGDVHPMLGSVFCPEPEAFVFNRNLGISDRVKIGERDNRYLADADEFVKSARNCETLVASYEGFMHLPEEALKAMVKWAGKYAESVVAIMYVRQPHSYAVSAMGQNVRMGKEQCPNGRIPGHNFKEKIGTLAKAFGRDAIIVRAFEPEQLVGKDIVVDFLHAIGAAEIVDTPDYVPSERVNQRMSAAAMTFGGTFAKSLIDSGIKLPSAEFQRKYGSVIATLPGDSIKLTPAQAESITQTSRPSLEFLKSEFGVEFKDNPEKYVSAADDSATTALITSIAEAVAEIIRRQFLLESAAGHIEVLNPVSEAAPGSDFQLKIKLFNESATLWQSSTSNPINVAYRYRKADGRLMAGGGGRAPLPNGRLRANDKQSLGLKVKAPKEPGQYELEISVVQEHHAWLDTKGFTKFSSKLTVA